MNPAFGRVSWKPTREAGFFGATGQHNGVTLLVQHRCESVWGEVKGDLGRTHFVVGSLEVEFGFEFRHGDGQGVAFIKASPRH